MMEIIVSAEDIHNLNLKSEITSFFKKWFAENCQGSCTEEIWKESPTSIDYFSSEYGTIGRIYKFELIEDAILFKLTFL